ncbi:hypothetical protein V8J36_18835 [Frigidibacter sp. MR17.14]|uniref:hypothetical protein n=1 Tax=Frigidibacter sp. MR17.14 TaxID=3126509 RepID=UPI003012E6CC
MRLAEGLAAAEALIEAERPEQIDLRHGERRLALAYLDPGAEPWCGHHLRPFLMNHCARPWLEQRMQAGGLASGPSDTGLSETERNAASRGLRHVAPHLNAAAAPFLWREQYASGASSPSFRIRRDNLRHSLPLRNSPPRQNIVSVLRSCRKPPCLAWLIHRRIVEEFVRIIVEFTRLRHEFGPAVQLSTARDPQWQDPAVAKPPDLVDVASFAGIGQWWRSKQTIYQARTGSVPNA